MYWIPSWPWHLKQALPSGAGSTTGDAGSNHRKPSQSSRMFSRWQFLHPAWRSPWWQALQSCSAPTPARSIVPGGMIVPFTTVAMRNAFELAWAPWQSSHASGPWFRT